MAAYDDLLDVLACQGARLDPAVWDDLVDRAAAHDVTHLGGGSAALGRPSPFSGPSYVAVPLLFVDLARAPEPRLRDATVALLLRHPEYSADARAVLDALASGTPAWTSLLARTLVAAAIGHRDRDLWSRVLPGYRPVEAGDLARAHGLPDPATSNGGPTLLAVQETVRGRFRTVDYVGGWEDAARHALREATGTGSYTRVVPRETTPARATG